MEFIFQYPTWFILFCLVLGAVYAAFLYFKSNAFSEDTPKFKYIKASMAFLRFLSVSILSFLLLSPLIKSSFVDKIEPSIVIAHDNSSSVLVGFKQLDSTRYIQSINELKNTFKDKYPLDFYSFSDNIYAKDNLDFSAKRTNISKTLEALNGNYFNQNVGALIMATDGIYNEGINPIYTDFNFPIYFIALGDTSVQKDLKLSNVNVNKIAYLGDEVEVQLTIESYELQGKTYELSVAQKGRKVYSKNLTINKAYTELNTSFTIDAASVGLQKYTIKLSEIAGEITFENNSSDFYLEVIDTRLKVLMLARAPHPDIAAFKNVINENKNFDFEWQYIKNISANLEKYNLIVLHDLPSNTEKATQVFAQIKKEKIPYFLIAGSQTDFSALNEIQDLLKVKISAQNVNDASLAFNTNFNAFIIDESTQSRLEKFPPLKVPFGDFKTSVNAKTLLNQKIGSIETDYPVLSFQENFGVKSAVFVGEGLWRWRLHDFLENKNHDAFNEIFSKSINYLALKSDKRKFRVNTSKNIFFETEEVVIDAALYNESYELVNEPEVSLKLTNENGEDFPLQFSRTSNAYVLKTQNLPVGAYNYIAKTNFDNKNYTAAGAFTIKALQIEALQTRANHKVLYQLAEKTGGKVFYPNEIEALQKLILEKEDIKPTLYESFKTRSMINLKWIFFLILGLLSVEWFSRKFYGAY